MRQNQRLPVLSQRFSWLRGSSPPSVVKTRSCNTTAKSAASSALGNGVVAQLVERLVRNEKVRGSNPLGSTTSQVSFRHPFGPLRNAVLSLPTVRNPTVSLPTLRPSITSEPDGTMNSWGNPPSNFSRHSGHSSHSAGIESTALSRNDSAHLSTRFKNTNPGILKEYRGRALDSQITGQRTNGRSLSPPSWRP